MCSVLDSTYYNQFWFTSRTLMSINYWILFNKSILFSRKLFEHSPDFYSWPLLFGDDFVWKITFSLSSIVKVLHFSSNNLYIFYCAFMFGKTPLPLLEHWTTSILVWAGNSVCQWSSTGILSSLGDRISAGIPYLYIVPLPCSSFYIQNI